jgi:hypothetical protein
MLRPFQRRSIRTKARTIIVLAMMPLAVANAWPVSAGCICADGHYEPVCRADNCRAGKMNCGCSCCERTECCSQKLTASVDANDVPFVDEIGCCAQGCCTPLVHVPQFAVFLASPESDIHAARAFAVSFFDAFSVVGNENLAQRFERKASPPPNDLVVVFHRLII